MTSPTYNITSARLLLTIALLLSGYRALQADERLIVSSLDATGQPIIKAKVYIADESWNVYRPQAASEFVIHTNNTPSPVISMNCRNEQSLFSASILMMANASLLTGSSSAITTQLFTTLVSALPTDGSTLAAAAFDEHPFLLRDFTSKKSSLANAYSTFKGHGGSNTDNAFLARPAGVFPLMESAKGTKVIILVTNGYGKLNTDSIIRQAEQLNARIICISIGIPLPVDAQKIADQTGGFSFNGIQTVQRAEEVAHEIYWRLSGVYPCEIVWKSLNSCGEVQGFSIEHPRTGAKTSFPYLVTRSSLPSLLVSPDLLDFGCQNTPSSKVLSVRSLLDDVTIQSIISDNPDFKASFPPGLVIPAGQEREISITYSPTDSLFTSARLTIQTDACPTSFTAVAGCEGQRLRPRTVLVVAPNGGENLIAGDTAVIVWQGTPKGGVARIEYSTDGGVQWNFITESSDTTKFTWTVPSTPSQQCMLRVLYFRAINKPSVFSGHSGIVNSARFSRNGAFVVTASDDQTIRVWNIKSALQTASYQFPGANEGVKCADFSPDGKNIAAVASANLSAVVLDAATGLEKDRLQGHSGGISYCEYSPEGKYLLTGSQDQTSSLWGIQDGLRIASLTGQTGEIISARFAEIISKNGADSIRLLTAAQNDRNAIMYNILYLPGSVAQLSYQFPAAVRAACYSQAARLYAFAFINGIVRITSDLTQKGIEFSAGEQLTDADFSPDGRMLLITSGDKSVKIFEVATGRELRTFAGHTAAVLSGRFSPDGTQIVTASADSTARVWDVNIGALQADTSDGFWRIGIKRLSAKPLDFGAIVVGSTWDSVFNAGICNGGTVATPIDSVVIAPVTGVGSGVIFEPVAGFPHILLPDSCGAITIRFSPKDERIYSAVGSIYSGGRIAREFTITGTGVRPLLQTVSLIDFGKTETGTFKDSTVRILVRNGHTAPLTIDSVWFGSVSAEFHILNAGSSTLSPGEIRTMDLRFEPLIHGRRSERLRIDYSEPGHPAPVGTPALIELFGEGICTPTNSFALVSPATTRIETVSGSRIQIPITVKPPSDIPLAILPASFTITARFNSSLLLPVKESERGTVSGGVRTIEIPGFRLPTQETLLTLDLFTAFGDADSTVIDISITDWPGCIPFSPVKPVTVVFTDICRANAISRLFMNGDKKLYLLATPNPIESGDGQVKFGLRESGQTRLQIVDVSGKVVRTLVNSRMDAGEYNIDAVFEVIPAGQYMLVLETPTKTLSSQITIAR